MRACGKLPWLRGHVAGAAKRQSCIRGLRYVNVIQGILSQPSLIQPNQFLTDRSYPKNRRSNELCLNLAPLHSRNSNQGVIRQHFQPTLRLQKGSSTESPEGRSVQTCKSLEFERYSVPRTLFEDPVRSQKVGSSLEQASMRGIRIMLRQLRPNSHSHVVSRLEVLSVIYIYIYIYMYIA